jgi:hypothetical protein
MIRVWVVPSTSSCKLNSRVLVQDLDSDGYILSRLWLNNTCRVDFAEICSPVLLRLMLIFKLEKPRGQDFARKSVIDIFTRFGSGLGRNGKSRLGS